MESEEQRGRLEERAGMKYPSCRVEKQASQGSHQPFWLKFVEASHPGPASVWAI